LAAGGGLQNPLFCGIRRHHQLAAHHCRHEPHHTSLVIQLADDIKVAPQQLALKRDAVSRISRPFPKQFLKAIQRLS
jgi:hypothetical protein